MRSALLTGCVGGLFNDTRLDDTLAIGRTAGLKPYWVRTVAFPLLAQSRIARPGEPLRIYIEGDGFAYVTRGQPSIDPTPINLVPLRLAAVDSGANIAWVARPAHGPAPKRLPLVGIGPRTGWPSRSSSPSTPRYPSGRTAVEWS